MREKEIACSQQGQISLEKFLLATKFDSFESPSNRQGKEISVVFREVIPIPTTYATFALYAYPAKFIPQVIAYILKNFATPGMKIFDPFAGYGTVGVVSRIFGYDYELWDLNPLLEILHSVATSSWKDIDVESLCRQMMQSQEEFTPRWSNITYWFPSEFLPFLYKVWGFYHSLPDGYEKRILTVPLLKVTRYFSYDDLQRMKLSKSRRSVERVNFLLNSDWKTKFVEMVKNETKKLLSKLLQYQRLSPKSVKSTIRAGVDTLSLDLEEEKDILITSPPYLQSHEYIRHSKMDLFWLGYSEEQIRKLSKLEIPYREVDPQPVYSELYKSIRDELSGPYRKIYDRYFWAVLGALTRLQKKVRHYLCLFVGRSSMRGKPVPIDRIFAEHFSVLGWEHVVTLVDTIKARRMFRYTVNPASKLVDARTPTEHLVILRKA
jgi:hypothetical protein